MFKFRNQVKNISLNRQILIIVLGSLFLLFNSLFSSAKASSDEVLQCKIKAKKVAQESYSQCINEVRENELDKIKIEYKDKLDKLKKFYERKIKKVNPKESNVSKENKNNKVVKDNKDKDKEKNQNPSEQESINYDFGNAVETGNTPSSNTDLNNNNNFNSNVGSSSNSRTYIPNSESQNFENSTNNLESEVEN